MPSLPGRGRRRAVVAAVAAAAWLWAAAPVAAHGELVASDPAANASLPEAPERLTLAFTEPVDAASALVELLDAEQQPVAGLGEVALADGGRRVEVSLPALDPGVYVVRYQILSTVDGHVTSGSFAFQLDPSGAAPPPAVAPTSSTPSADLPTALARWLALLGALALFGSAVFWRFAGRPALTEGAAVGQPLHVWSLFRSSALLCFAALVLFLTLAGRELPTAGGIPGDVAAPFGWTPFAIAMRIALLGSFAAFAFATAWWLRGRLRRRTAPPGEQAALEHGPLAVILGLGLVTLAGFSFAGHVAALGGPLFALLDLAHLAAVGVWLGSLPGFLVFYFLALRGTDAAVRRATAGAALRRHSRLALLAAPIVALTGVTNSPIVLGASRNLVASDYGNLLLGKALLFGVAVGIGAANFLLVRRLAVRQLLVTIGAETLVAALAVLTAAGLLTVPAAASRAPRLVTADVPTAHLYADTGELSVHAIVSVPAPGRQTYQAAVSDPVSGEPVGDLQRVFMRFLPPDGSGLTEQRVPLEPTDRPGLFEATGAYTPVEGEWGLEVTLRRAGVPDAAVDFKLPVSLPPPPERLPPADTGIGVPVPLAYLWRFIPPSPYEWLPALSLFGLAGVLWVAAPAGRSRADGRARRLAALRTATVALGVAAVLVTGSQALVFAANAGADAVLPSENPVPATADSIAAGERAFGATCASCHGVDGRGDGPAAEGLAVRPADLPTHVPFHDDAELFAFATRGISGTPMPGFAIELTAEDRWNLVNYLRSRWPAP